MSEQKSSKQKGPQEKRHTPKKELSADKAASRDKRTLDYLIAILGFGCCRAWIVFCLAAPLQENVYAFNWVYLVSGALAALFVAFAVKSLKGSLIRTRSILYRTTVLTLLLSAVIIPFSSAYHIELLLLTGYILGGVGAGMLQVLWGERFALFETRFVTLVSPAAAIITAFLVTLTIGEVVFIGYILLPLLSLIFLFLMSERSGLHIRTLFEPYNWSLLEENEALIDETTFRYFNDKTHPETGFEETSSGRKQRGAYFNDVGKLMFSIMVFSCLCRLFDTLPLQGNDPFLFFGGSVLFSLIIVGTAFFLLAFFLKDRFNPLFTYRLSLPIMVAGFVAIALLFDSHAAQSILIINIGYEFFDILTWILFTQIARWPNQKPLHVFGLGVAFMFAGMALGYLGGDVLNSFMVSGDLHINVIAMLSILSLVVVGFLVIPEGTVEQLLQAFKHNKGTDEKRSKAASELPAEQESAELVGKSRIERNAKIAAERYRLTPRETEVLDLLAHGRTLAIIARDLHTAKGTVRTHMENIYRKLGVHKQQELIDLVESCDHPDTNGDT